ncbi:hypothetical protein [Magnetospirillum sp. UT-4]|uniref:hypothetical protein n=1 Tax=Magnetospirillum sp. UT-4 TaxID=2681467 RepID=UPI00137FBC18|nr:hypothetical protein [Magnetospirillum sp. UT-4]CAA7627004.1 conserved hypothetical protein [Magnetospirillum sp. UT-4]
MRLFRGPTNSRPQPIEPPVERPARPEPPAIILLPPPRAEARPRFDLRNVSPRRFAEIAHELYVEGSLRWEEYQWVGFPSQLSPDYDSTIGALTGEPAEPDRPRDMLAEMESRIAFLMRFRRDDSDRTWRAERALDVLRRQMEPRCA